jgi:transposase
MMAMTTLIVGVDVSKDTLDLAWTTDKNTLDTMGSVKNDPEHLEALAQAIEKQARLQKCDAVWLVAEPTGGYERRLACFAHQRGWQVSLPNPRQVHQWGQGMGKRSKTDRQDAMLLAQYGLACNPLPWTPMPEEVSMLSDLLDRKDDLKKMERQEQNRQKALQAQDRYQGPIKQSIECNLAHLAEMLSQLDKEIKRYIDQHPKLKAQSKRLQKTPGIGKKSVLRILELCAHWDSLTQGRGTVKGLTAYVGLDPQHFQSGSSVHKRSKISHQGNKVYRSQLFMSALGGIRSKTSVLRQFYDRLVAAGKPKMVALIAAARKILVWAWAIYRKGVAFDPNLAAAR